MLRLTIALTFAVLTLMLLARSVGASAVPPIEAVQRQALQVAGLTADTSRQWSRRVRWKAALPQLRVAVQRDLTEDFRITQKDNISISGGNVTIGPDEQDIVRDFDTGTRIGVVAVWQLDRLVFNRDSILVSQERRRMNEEKYRLIERVVTYYFERQRAEEALGQGHGIGASKRRALTWMVRERTAQLDALTDGWFSRSLREHR